MSFIYAHKLKNTIRILSDTKPTITSNDIARLKKRFDDDEYKNFIKYGFIKTIIYRPNITISSAGDVEHFNEFLRFLYDNNIDDVKLIISKAFELNFKYNGDTDFIITTEKDIYEVTEKGAKNVSFSWIGDKDAFNEFNKLKDNNIHNEIYYTEEVSENTRKLDMELCLIDDAFESLISNKKVNTVGGFVVRCIYEDEKYKFLGAYISTSVKSQVVKSGDVIKFDSSKEDGGFTFMSFESCNYYYGYFSQIDKYIVYKTGYTDDNYRYISMPYIVDSKEQCNYME
jgi:hypothetical protein